MDAGPADGIGICLHSAELGVCLIFAIPPGRVFLAWAMLMDWAYRFSRSNKTNSIVWIR